MATRMEAEAAEAPARVAAMLAGDEEPYTALAAALRERPPPFAVTIARGSSDHAATYLASLLGIVAGRVTASLPPSLLTRYGAELSFEGALVVALSQSGASPDLVRCLEAARAAGATTVAIVNAEGSPLAAAAEHVLPQRAGPEQAVAATKSFIATLAVAARLVATWRADGELGGALTRLPDSLEAALRCDWGHGVEALREASSLYTVARGPTLAVAQEAALKLKETSGLHAEAVSAAEIQHGPRGIVAAAFPLLALAPADPGGADTRAVAAELAAAGARVLCACPEPAADHHLSLPPPLHPLLDPIVAIQAFYPFAAQLARARGRDPDRPAGLSKVTQTL